MTVADLIRELQAMPNQNIPVRVVLTTAWLRQFDGSYDIEHLTDEAALEADDVRHEGPFVLIRSK